MSYGLLRVTFILPDIKFFATMQDCVGIWRVQKGKLDEGYLYKRSEALDVTDLLHEVTTIITQGIM